MENNRIIVLLTRKVAGELGEAEAEELSILLQDQPDAVYYDEFLQELWNQRAKDDPLSEEYYLKHKKRHGERLAFGRNIRQEKQVQAGKSVFRKRVIGIGFLGTVFLATLWIGYIKNRPIKDNDRNGISVIAERGVRRQVNLPDGTKVWLNADSRLDYTNFAKDNVRSVQLEGEAYFDVAKNTRKPFIIKTRKISIRVLGTAFNVKAYARDNRTETTLLKGAIELMVNGRPAEKYVLKPTEKLAVIEKASKDKMGQKRAADVTLTIGSLSRVQVGDHEYVQETSWVNNKMIFKDETMAELIPKLERWYNVNIQVENQTFLNYRYTGTITKENLQQTLKAMQLIKMFHYKIEENDVTIY